MIPELLEIAVLREAFIAGTLTPVQLVTTLLQRIDEYPDKAVFITRVAAQQCLDQALSLHLAEIGNLPLFGIPFVVKDNIDVAGLPTTAACPDFSYMPAVDAVAVARLRAAGAIVLGKTNLDQFATGLNGTRSPYGAPRCVFDGRYISGGSSSGSAVAVGAGLAVFSLGTDTAGSGRVPAAFNNIIGLKPSIGRIATTGLVPACKSLDCISVFSNSAADAMAVLDACEGPDSGDSYSRRLANVPLPTIPRAGILRQEDRDFAGDDAAAGLYAAALTEVTALGWELVEVDYAPFRQIAASLYAGAFVAERLAAVEAFFKQSPDSFDPTVRQIIAGASEFSAVEAFQDIYRNQASSRVAQAELAKCDILLLPTAPTIFTVDEMLAAPIAANAKLGVYTNFVNFLDMAGIALPAGFRPDGLPFGVTLLGPAFSESALSGYADRLHAALNAGAGKQRLPPKTRYDAPLPEARDAPLAETRKTIVVAGAHLSGMPLNHELLALGAEFIAAAKTAANYQLYELNTAPPKPGLVRAPGFAGPGIAVELWSLTAENFGEFVAMLPAPMGIGKVTLADCTEHPGFLCEHYALENAKDITSHGGWKAFRAFSMSS